MSDGTIERPDAPTLVAIAVLAYGAANLVHEGIGHGGMCVAAGCTPEMLSAISFAGDDAAVSAAGRRWIAAGGSLANVAAALPALVLLRRARTPHARVFLWLFAYVNLLQAAGYLLFSGIGNVGDWAIVIAGAQPTWLWRGGMTVLGAWTYVVIARACARDAAPLVGARDPARAARARRIAWTAYFAGGALFVIAGLPNPHGLALVLVSAAAASFGGTSALLWCMSWLRNPAFAGRDAVPAVVTRHRGWLAAGALMAMVFVGVFGPGVRL